MAEIERVKTGIEGFDEIIEGGFPRNSIVLISGSPGTGKTIFSLQYIYNGVTEFNEKGVFVTLGEPVDSLRVAGSRFGMDIAKLEKQKKIALLQLDPRDRDFMKRVKDTIKKIKAKRLVIDPLSSLTAYAPFLESVREAQEKVLEWGKDVFVMPAVIGEGLTRMFVHSLIDDLRKFKCTTLLTTEQPEAGEWLSRDTVSEFVCDGVIVLRALTITGEIGRSLIARKMRKTKHDLDVHPLEITGKGLKVLPVERGIKI